MPHLEKSSRDDIRLHYVRGGAGPEVVMIHGLGANLAFWQLRIAPRLAREFTVTTYDLRGHGYSDAPAHGYRAQTMAGDLARLLDGLRIERAHIVAHSFGADVALRFAVACPERVATLTLADPVLVGPPWTRNSAAWSDRSIDCKLADLGVDTLLRTSSPGPNPLHPPGPANGTAVPRIVDGFRPFGLWHGTTRSGRRFDELWHRTAAREELLDNGAPSTDDVRGLPQAVLVIVGGRSRYRRISMALGRTLRNCRLMIVRGAGHFHPMVRPVRFTQAVRAFLREHEQDRVVTDATDAARA